MTDTRAALIAAMHQALEVGEPCDFCGADSHDDPRTPEGCPVAVAAADHPALAAVLAEVWDEGHEGDEHGLGQCSCPNPYRAKETPDA